MANIWEKDISILAGNLNLGGNYLVTAVNVLKDIQKSIGDWKKNQISHCALELLLFMSQEDW